MSRTDAVCVAARSHRPRYAETDGHHVLPTFLGHLLYPGFATDARLFRAHPELRETVELCSGCHDLIHHLIEHLVDEGTLGGHHPPAGIRELLERFRAWWQPTVVAEASA